MSNLADPLVDYLHQLERKGETHVHLDERARLVLREFYKRAKGISSEPAVAKPQVSLSEKPEVPVVHEVAPIEVKQDASSLDDLKAQIAADSAIKELGSLRDTLVFSEGDSSSDVMLVGEAPGYHDESQGTPFSGPAGKKMEAILKAMGLARGDVYMTNIVKYRPAKQNQTTNTRKPNAEELDVFMPYLMQEVKLVQPKVIIVLGATAARRLIPDEVPINKMLGEFHNVAGVPVRATYHPSYLLHSEVTDEKRAVWQDMLAVMELLDMPISEKQRGYFKKK